MLTGELTESVRRRSVLGALQKGQTEDLVFSLAGPLPGYTDLPWRQVSAAANCLAAKGAVPQELFLQGMLPVSTEEEALREDMRKFAEEAKGQGFVFQDAGIQVSSSVSDRQYFVTAVGRTHRSQENLQPGQTLILAGRIALSGTAALARKYEAELKTRFPARLIDRARAFDRFFSITETARAVNHFGSCPMQPLAQGGIFRTLWEMAENAEVGLEVDIRKIPVKQETIEICEYFDLNPYSLYSAGALLIGTVQAEALMEVLAASGIPAAAIGYVKAGKDRILRNGENRRFLDRPGRDEFWKGEEK